MVLFRPFIKLRITGSFVSPKVVCLEAADAIQGLSRSYAHLYTLRRTPSFTPYFVLMSSTIHLTIELSLPPAISTSSQSGSVTPPGSSGQVTKQQQQSKIQPCPASTKAIKRGIEDLNGMVSCHASAEEAIAILLHLATKWQIDIDTVEEAEEKHRPDSSPYDAATPSASSRHGLPPVTDSRQALSLDIIEHHPDSSPTHTPRQPILGWEGIDQATQAWSREEEEMAIMPEMVEDSLLWPFAVRHRPMLPVGDKLREAGFGLLVARE